ncbi:NrdH-like glutaredoxin [Mycobacterium phage Aminay]|uniref:NrdH-like glutaredoxin n=1 Tax=Mycobacterium phage Aminay TaxID=2250291 RepID=A0A345KV51_9CAUD|nr:NrdH-like glutaredoxin [Mycobacterium phage Aminay]AXH46903.1 NrdH-like glutaredoxin [Mycobacterium phage Aminay]
MAAPPITVYTTGPQCMKCNLTKRQLDNLGAEYVEIRLDQEPEIADRLRENGYAIAPVVEVLTPAGMDRWSDFRPDRITAAARAVA